MLSRAVTYIVLGFVLAGFIATDVPCMAEDHSAAPALTGPSNAPGGTLTEADLEHMGDAAGKAAGELVHRAIDHPLGGETDAHGTHHGPKAAHDPNPLSWRADTAIFTGVIFLIVFGLLYKFAWGPISEGLAKRESGIADDIAAAQKSNDDARALLAEYQAQLDAAQGEVKAMIDKARVDAGRTGEKIVEAAHDAAAVEQKRALAEIEQATDGALGELAAKSADLAISLAGKIMKSKLKASDHASLVSEAVSNFGKTNKA